MFLPQPAGILTVFRSEMAEEGPGTLETPLVSTLEPEESG
jgi:hypothetical protein